jgi:hypothetical protein
MVTEGKRLATEAGNQSVLDMFNNTSKVAVWKIFFYTMAFAVWSLETVFDKFQTLIETMLAALLPHTLKWYRTKALAFQFGFNLLPDSDQFDNGTASTQQIEDSKVVKYAAVNETTVDSRRVLLIKVAAETDGDLSQLTAVQEAAFTAYMQKIKDAGNKLIIYNRLADLLRCEIDVYYNPLLLDADGNRLDGEGQPINDAAKSYLRNLPFNGEFSIAAFSDALQAAYGVSDNNVFVKKFERKTGDAAWQAIANTFIPDAGYTRFDTDGLTVNYISHVQS